MASDFPIMVRYGMRTMQAIQDATSVAGRAAQTGTQFRNGTGGMVADIVAVAGDPLAISTRLFHVPFVMKGRVSTTTSQRV